MNENSNKSNNSKGYIQTSIVIENLKVDNTAEQYLFVRRLGLEYAVGFLKRDVTARSRGGGRR